MSRPVLLDLFAGKGGWSRAAIKLGWNVVGIDNTDHGYPGWLDQESLPLPVRTLKSYGPDLVVASPPCEDFARAWLPWLRGDHRPSRQAVKMLRWSVRLIEAMAPIPVVVECSLFASRHVAGARKFGSYALWGPVPDDCPKITGKQKRSGENPAARAMIPFALAAHILNSVHKRKAA